MTLSATLAPLALWAVIGQILVYFALPFRLRTRLSPIVTGVAGMTIVVLAGSVFGWGRIGLIGGLQDAAALGAGTVAVILLTAHASDLLDRELVPRDPRLASLSPSRASFEIGLRIPLLTAFVEEAVFRGVLHAALVAVYPVDTAIWLGAGLFGVWHVAPGIDQALAGEKSPRQAARHTVITVIATGFAGLVLVWLRVSTGSIWASVAVHAAVNSSLAFVVWWRGRHSRSAPRSTLGRQRT